MHAAGSVLIQELDRLAELCTADDGVVDEQQILVGDKIVHGYLLHLGDLVAVALLSRHEGARPCGRVFDERARKVLAAAVGIADGVRRAGIGNAADVVDLNIADILLVVIRHDSAVAVAHDLDVHTLVGRGRVAVVAP